jgi:hypothetical protein
MQLNDNNIDIIGGAIYTLLFGIILFLVVLLFIIMPFIYEEGILKLIGIELGLLFLIIFILRLRTLMLKLKVNPKLDGMLLYAAIKIWT